MTPEILFDIQLALGYVPWLLVFGAYGWPKLRAMEAADAHRAIAALHSFRFFGLVFLIPGVVGTALPPGFAVPAAWGDFATGVLAMLAIMSFRTRPLFWPLVLAFNVVGLLDLVNAYYHGVKLGLPAGQLGSAYAILIVYVPILAITHIAAFVLLARSRTSAAA